MITKEKNRTKIICAVVTAISAIVAGGSAFQLHNVQNISQTVNGNVIQILGETGSYVSVGTDLTDSTDELISAYRKVLDENSQYQANQSTLQGQVQSLQNENDDLKNQIQILKGTLLNTYSSDEINSVIEQGGLKRDISKRLDNLECLDSVHCEQVPSVKDCFTDIPQAIDFLPCFICFSIILILCCMKHGEEFCCATKKFFVRKAFFAKFILQCFLDFCCIPVLFAIFQ